jgi:hypothetical protein
MKWSYHLVFFFKAMAPELRELLGQDILMAAHSHPIEGTRDEGRKAQLAPSLQHDENPYQSPYVNDGGLSPVVDGLDNDTMLKDLSSIPHDHEILAANVEEEMNHHPPSSGFPMQPIEMHELAEFSQGNSSSFTDSPKSIAPSSIVWRMKFIISLLNCLLVNGFEANPLIFLQMIQKIIRRTNSNSLSFDSLLPEKVSCYLPDRKKSF